MDKAVGLERGHSTELQAQTDVRALFLLLFFKRSEGHKQTDK